MDRNINAPNSESRNNSTYRTMPGLAHRLDRSDALYVSHRFSGANSKYTSFLESNNYGHICRYMSIIQDGHTN